MAKNNASGKKQSAQEALIDSENFIKDIVRSALQEFLEAEMTGHIGAEPYERSGKRSGSRNGHYKRQLKLTVGKIELSIPQARDGSFSTELFERFQRNEKALVLSLMEMYQNGVSTRKVSNITETLCGTTFSKSTVSELCKQLASDINSVFAETTRDKAMARAAEVADKWRESAPKVALMLDDDIEQCLRVLAFPSEHQKRLRTNNGLERLNEEIRRRDRVIRIFPNVDSALRLIATLCIEQSEEWITSHNYLDMSLLDQPDMAVVEWIGESEVEDLRKVS